MRNAVLTPGQLRKAMERIWATRACVDPLKPACWGFTSYGRLELFTIAQPERDIIGGDII
jgi:hypothetical protein